ncbi:hypothetical protein L7F22_058175 [Adiantum nelumboides]|nr:hypothetical protein [Adiantum nelumboides]
MSRVYVGNVEPRTSERELEDEFRGYGVLRSVWVARKPPGYAFVEFDDKRDALDAIQGLNAKRLPGSLGSEPNYLQSGHDGIWTIIDRFSKQAHFIPVKKTIKPDHLARLFVAQIFRLHGMPETIVSDRDPRFTSLFWKAIWENIGTRLQFSSSFHPQTDGQSEIANSVVLDLLKSYISDEKTQWERYLPLVEFAYNNTIHSSTGKAPFEIVEGAMKVPPFLSTKDKIFEADEYTRDLDTAFAKELKDEMSAAFSSE